MRAPRRGVNKKSPAGVSRRRPSPNGKPAKGGGYPQTGLRYDPRGRKFKHLSMTTIPSEKLQSTHMRKTTSFLCACLLLAAASLPARAQLLIYHGTGTHFTATQPGWSATENSYLIVDLSSQEISLIVYGKFNGKKNYNILLNETSLDNAQVSSGTKLYQAFSYVSHEAPAPGAFLDEAAFFRGLSTKVNVSGSVGHYNTGSYPPTLGGLYRYSAVGLGSAYDEQNFTLGYSQTLTVNYNNSVLTISEAQSDIIGTLQAAGYQFY